ncbi:MAG: MBL fold metallo-hydrolase [bacterium]|nr:MBL fold metallo-hydrolase [bacterium]
MLNVESQVAGPFAVNSLIVWCERTRQAAIFDAPGETETLIERIAARGLHPVCLVNTHGHCDHILANREVKEHFGIPLLIHPLDRPMLTDPARNLSLYLGESVLSPDADGTLADGDTLTVGEGELVVKHVPGHSPGSLVFYHPGFIISGDTLFAGGIGRTDFPDSCERDLLEAIRVKLYTLPGETVVYPGHGPTTTIREERQSNPFVRA